MVKDVGKRNRWAGLDPLDDGDDWLTSGTSLMAEVPSVVVPEESCILLNPTYPAMARVQTRNTRPRQVYPGNRPIRIQIDTVEMLRSSSYGVRGRWLTENQVCLVDFAVLVTLR